MYKIICVNRSYALASCMAVSSMQLLSSKEMRANSSSLTEQRLVAATFNANSPTEDRHFVHNMNGWSVGGILDGHGGWQVADFACSSFLGFLMPRIIHQPSGNEKAIVASLETAFAQVEAAYIDSIRNAYHLGFRDVGKVGACALIAMRNGADLYVANCGDCRAVLGSALPSFEGENAPLGDSNRDRTGERVVSTRLSRDMNARTPLEALILRQAHPGEDDIIKCKNPHACYVKGRLQLTRALGDLYLKHAEFNAPKAGAKAGGRYIPAPYTPPYVSSQPEINYFQLDERDKFLILASDGVWDFLSDQEAVEVVVASVTAHGGSTEFAASDLVEATLLRAADLNDMGVDDLKSLKEGSERRKRYDDTTAVVMFFHDSN